MKNDKPASGQDAKLRSSAEEKITALTSKISPQNETDLKVLVHELQVHQIELEMQNEELQRTQRELEAARVKYAALYDFAPVGYFTLDNSSRILEVNLMGAMLLGIERGKLLNHHFTEYMSETSSNKFHNFLKEIFSDAVRKRCELQLQRRDGMQWHAQLEGVADAGSEEIGGCCQMVVIDVSDRVAAEAERERVLAELKQAMSKVKLLSGMLPICTSCKKIRDDKGYWNLVEKYIMEHSEAQLTHGLCPECAKKLYPEFFKID